MRDDDLAEGRTIALGDIHGCLAALGTLLEIVGPRPDDTIVTLGDYVDRGPDSRGVIDKLLDLRSQCRLIPLMGNHDEMFLDICTGRKELFDQWLLFGGDATVASYDGRVPEGVPEDHLEFLRAGLVPGDVARVHGTAAGRAAIESELGALASALEIPVERASGMCVPLGRALGETMGAGATLATAAGCARGVSAPTLVVSVQSAGPAPSAVAILLGAA